MNKWLKIGMASSALGALASVAIKDWVMMFLNVTMFCTFVLDGFNGPKGPSQTGKGAPA